MSTFSDTSPIIIKKRKGTSEEPYKPITENLNVEYNIGILNEIPDNFKRVQIEGMFEKRTDYYDADSKIKENEYIVDYKLGFVYFNERMNKKTVKVNYLGTGIVLYPASRIYDTGKKDIIVTIQEMIDGGRKAIEAYSSIDKAIEVAKDYYVKITTSTQLAKNTDENLNMTIVNGNNINDLLNNSIKEATNINDVLGGTIANGVNIINNISVCEDYNPSKHYKKLNRVVYNGSSYECIKDCKNIFPINDEYWICIAEKGAISNIYWSDIKDKPNLSEIEKVQSVNNLSPDLKGNISIFANNIKLKDETTIEENIDELKKDVQINLNKIGDLSVLEKKIIDILTIEKKEINLTNAINYLYQNSENGNGAVRLSSTQNLTAHSNAEGTKAILSWQNPIVTEFQKVEIYVSTNDLISANYDYCIKNATRIVDNNITKFEYNAKSGTYYFKAFAIYNIFGVLQHSEGVVTSVKILDTKPPSTITNLKTTIGNSEITLRWTNPNDNDFSKVKIIRKEGSKPTSENDGVVVYEGGLTIYKDIGLTNGLNYYYRFFTYDINNNINNTDTQFINAIPLANGYDKSITNFNAQSRNTEVILSWVNPSGKDFSKVMIRRKTDEYPNKITDGNLVYEGNSTNCKDVGLTNGVQYYYRAFTFSSNNQYCDITNEQQVIATPQLFKEYGVRWNKLNDTIERLGDAKGLTAITQGQNDFNDLLPWSGIKRCNLSDSGDVNAYYGSPTYKVDGSNGQCMVEIPKFWFKVVNISDDMIEFWICDGAKDGYEVHPAFFRDRQHLCDDNNGIAIEVDYRYIGTYEATEYTGNAYQGGNGYSNDSPTYNSSYKLSSVSGFYPVGNRNMSQIRTLARNRGCGWGIQDYYLTYAIQLLYLIEYAHFNSQKKIGNGNSDSLNILKTGVTDSYGSNSYGTVSNTSTAMSYRGIENFYGNTQKWIDGLCSDNNRNLIFANNGFDNNCTNYNNIYKTGISSNIKNGYINDIWNDKILGFIAKTASGGSEINLCDSGSLYDNSVACFGGNCSYGSHCGCFCLEIFYKPIISYANYSARIAF